MQAVSLITKNSGYDDRVKTGRPPKQARSEFGSRLHRLREEAGLSQAMVAKQLSIPQRTYAYWERADIALRANQLAAIADIFGVSCDYLIGQHASKNRGKGPAGKLNKVFVQASDLPRRQQQRVVEIVEDMLAAHEAKAS